MPSSPGYKRNYKQEAKYHASPEQKKKRASRNAARAKLMKAGKVKKGDGKDVDHRNGNPKDNKKSNLAVKSKSANRSFPRNKKAGKK
jgi:ribosome maturation factor RimP